MHSCSATGCYCHMVHTAVERSSCRNHRQSAARQLARCHFEMPIPIQQKEVRPCVARQKQHLCGDSEKHRREPAARKILRLRSQIEGAGQDWLWGASGKFVYYCQHLTVCKSVQKDRKGESDSYTCNKVGQSTKRRIKRSSKRHDTKDCCNTSWLTAI